MYRCNACGNKTRFDIVERKRVRAYLHFTLGGEASVEEEEVLEREIERIACRWCGSLDEVVTEAPPGGATVDEGSTSTLEGELAGGSLPGAVTPRPARPQDATDLRRLHRDSE